jgi:hypothetical protein
MGLDRGGNPKDWRSKPLQQLAALFQERRRPHRRRRSTQFRNAFDSRPRPNSGSVSSPGSFSARLLRNAATHNRQVPNQNVHGTRNHIFSSSDERGRHLNQSAVSNLEAFQHLPVLAPQPRSSTTFSTPHDLPMGPAAVWGRQTANSRRKEFNMELRTGTGEFRLAAVLFDPEAKHALMTEKAAAQWCLERCEVPPSLAGRWYRTPLGQLSPTHYVNIRIGRFKDNVPDVDVSIMLMENSIAEGIDSNSGRYEVFMGTELKSKLDSARLRTLSGVSGLDTSRAADQVPAQGAMAQNSGNENGRQQLTLNGCAWPASQPSSSDSWLSRAWWPDSRLLWSANEPDMSRAADQVPAQGAMAQNSGNENGRQQLTLNDYTWPVSQPSSSESWLSRAWRPDSRLLSSGSEYLSSADALEFSTVPTSIPAVPSKRQSSHATSSHNASMTSNQPLLEPLSHSFPSDAPSSVSSRMNLGQSIPPRANTVNPIPAPTPSSEAQFPMAFGFEGLGGAPL